MSLAAGTRLGPYEILAPLGASGMGGSSTAAPNPSEMVIPAALAGALADRYRLEREVGRGGMATVYLAHDLKHDRRVAIKVMDPELAAAIGRTGSCARSRSPLDSPTRTSCRPRLPRLPLPGRNSPPEPW